MRRRTAPDRAAAARVAANGSATAERSGAAPEGSPPLKRGHGRTGRPVGRPPKYSRAIADQVINLVSGGATLLEACRELGVDDRTVRGWIVDDVGGIFPRYSRARALLLEHWADDIVSISDDRTGDVYVDADGKKRVDHENINRSRLRVDTRKWLLSKLRPEQYGDHVNLDVKSAAPPVFIVALARPTRDPLALQASPPPDAEDAEITEQTLDVSRLVEMFRAPKPPSSAPDGVDP